MNVKSIILKKMLLLAAAACCISPDRGHISEEVSAQAVGASVLLARQESLPRPGKVLLGEDVPAAVSGDQSGHRHVVKTLQILGVLFYQQLLSPVVGLGEQSQCSITLIASNIISLNIFNLNIFVIIIILLIRIKICTSCKSDWEGFTTASSI